MGAESHLGFGDLSPENSLKHEGTATAVVEAPAETKADFSGWASKANILCTDGRTIMSGAFQHQDKARVPLVWQHGHNDPKNVLGYAILEHRDEGVYAYGYFNETEDAKHAKQLVEHGDIDSLSIFANQLVEKAKKVTHGIIRELSLVIGRANPGALIDNIELTHSDGETVTLDDEAIIWGGELVHEDGGENEGPTIQEIYTGMTDEQKEVVHYMVGAAIESKDESTAEHSTNGNKKENRRTMSRNVFEQQNGSAAKKEEKHVLSHDAMRGIVADMQRRGSMREAVNAYAIEHGINDIDILFPDAKNVNDRPEFDSRRMGWVAPVLSGTRHSPFSRIKSIVADITVEEARALGYVKGSLKKEEFFGLAARVTTPSTVYKKQKLDRDDIVDITDFDVVAWMKAEMRVMLDEELARAILIGDGRDVADDDKIKDPAGAPEGAGIRSIVNDHDLYAAKVEVDLTDAGSNPGEVVDALILNMALYKGSGSPTFYTTLPFITQLLLAKDTLGRRLYRSVSDIAAEMGVSSIVTVEVMEGETDLIGIVVNLNDYTVGADRGGEVSLFDDFDIDYNQYKYLLETRVSGALTKIRSAIVLTKK
jgi:Caudovirus prohead serine protease